MTYLTHDVMFRNDNTEGYSDVELELLNNELAEQLNHIEPGTDEYYRVAKQFADVVSHR